MFLYYSIVMSMSLPPALTALLRILSRDIRELKNAINKHSDATHAASKEHKDENLPLQLKPVTVDFADSVKQDGKKQHDKTYKQQNRIIFWTRLTIGILVVTTGVTAWQACETHRATDASIETVREMRTQNNLVRQQLESTQAAVANAGLSIMYPPSKTLPIIIRNSGRGIAFGFRATFTVTQASLPKLLSIGTPYEIRIPPETIPAADGDTPGSIHKQYDLPNFRKEDWGALGNLKRTIKATWECSYDNGFGRIVTCGDCMYFSPTNFSAQGGNVAPNGWGWVPCTLSETYMQQILTYRDVAEAEAQKQRSKPD